MLCRLKKHKYKYIAVLLVTACLVSVFSISVSATQYSGYIFEFLTPNFLAYNFMAPDGTNVPTRLELTESGYAEYFDYIDDNVNYGHTLCKCRKDINGSSLFDPYYWIGITLGCTLPVESLLKNHTLSSSFKFKVLWSYNSTNNIKNWFPVQYYVSIYYHYVGDQNMSFSRVVPSSDINLQGDSVTDISFDFTADNDLDFVYVVFGFSNNTPSMNQDPNYSATLDFFDFEIYDFSMNVDDDSSAIINSIDKATYDIQNSIAKQTEDLLAGLNAEEYPYLPVPSEVGDFHSMEQNALGAVDNSLSAHGFNSPTDAVTGLTNSASLAMNGSKFVASMKFVGWCLESLIDSSFFQTFFDIVIPLGLTVTLLGIGVSVGRDIRSRGSRKARESNNIKSTGNKYGKWK